MGKPQLWRLNPFASAGLRTSEVLKTGVIFHISWMDGAGIHQGVVLCFHHVCNDISFQSLQVWSKVPLSQINPKVPARKRKHIVVCILELAKPDLRLIRMVYKRLLQMLASRGARPQQTASV